MFEKIQSIILEYVDVKPEDITPETQFLADLEMSSLDIMTMIGEIEENFDVEINTEDMRDIFTIQNLIDYLETLKEA